MGWIDPVKRPRMVTVQAEHCAPIIRAFHDGSERSTMWEHARTVADGLRVPKAVGDFLVLRAVRESHGAALAVNDPDMVTGMKDLGSLEGISAAPEGGAALHAVRMLVASSRMRQHVGRFDGWLRAPQHAPRVAVTGLAGLAEDYRARW